MRIIVIFIIISSLFATELEVDGDLVVTGNIDSPTIEALSVMKADRIYNKIVEPGNGPDFYATVPPEKLWIIHTVGGGPGGYFQFNGSSDMNFIDSGFPIYVIQNTAIVLGVPQTIHLSIHEYPISNSGTDQGMDYVEP